MQSRPLFQFQLAGIPVLVQPFYVLVLAASAFAYERSVQLAGPLPHLGAVAIRFAIFVNIWWSLFNLLPILPLDGSHVLDHLSRVATGRHESRWVGWLSLVTGGAVALYGARQGMIFVVLIGGIGAGLGLQRVRGGEPGRRSASPSSRLTAFARRADAVPLARLAAEALAEKGAWSQALEVSQLAFQQLHIPYHAYDAACHLVRLGRLDEAVRWVETAIEAGLDGPGTLVTDPALEPLRQRDDFLAAVTRSAGRSGTA